MDLERCIAEVPTYVRMIAAGTVQVEARAYPLSQVADALTAPPGPRPVLVAA